MSTALVSRPVLAFPSHVREWTHPGIRTSLNTEKAFKETDGRADAFANLLIARGIPLEGANSVAYKFFFSRAVSYTEEADVGKKGFRIDEPYALENVNYRTACDFVENHVLPTSLAKRSPDGIIKMLCDIHKRLLDSIPIADPDHPPPGEIRKQGQMLALKQPDKVSDKAGGLAKYLLNESQKAKEPSQRTILNQQLLDARYLDLYLSDKDIYEEVVTKKSIPKPPMQLFNRFFTVFPRGERVKSLMDAFTKDLQKRLLSGEDPISLACKAHLGLVRIHPFPDGNGRMARMLMNIILMQGGHQPIAFVFNSSYTKAICEKNEGVAGAFEKFVRGLVKQFDYEALPVSELPSSILSNKERYKEIFEPNKKAKVKERQK